MFETNHLFSLSKLTRQKKRKGEQEQTSMPFSFRILRQKRWPSDKL
jgi:hypothetical protein